MTRALTVALALLGLAACQAVDVPAATTSGPGEAHTGRAHEAAISTGTVKARIAILFDTSGSMTDNVCNNVNGNQADTGGDGSVECPGNDVPCCTTGGQSSPSTTCPSHPERCNSPTCSNSTADDSRIFKVKAGISLAVAAFGEIEWALYRFHQTQGSFSCASGGGWRGAPQDNNCAGSAYADPLVGFDPENQYEILGWMDNQSNNGNPPPLGMDHELRGTGFTPLDGSLTFMKSDLAAIIAGDSVGTCRPYRVVVVTDGLETCGGDPVTAAGNLKNGTPSIPVSVIGFASAGLKANMDAIAQAGSGQNAFLVTSPDALSAALAQIVSQTVLVERCNGLDDDCDGVKDNGFNVGAPCDNGQKGTCFRQGSFVCTTDGSGTTCNAPHVTPGNEADHGCNGLDDDCDGVVDNGLQCSGCGMEVCNGIDDDCNGKIDDGTMPGVGEPCQINVGECHPGTYICSGGRLVCDGYTGPSPEICDGLDNNCDGVVDQITEACYDFDTGCVDIDPSPSTVKYTCTGRCRSGIQTCKNGSFGACAGEVGPTAELCNGQDDDCDGLIDEDFTQLGAVCEVGKGLCKTTGKYVCSADGKGVVCDAPIVTGVPEVCNNQDDDCDGVIDNLPNPPPAPIGEPCGSCGGRYVCNGGLVCSGGTGSPETCNGLDDDCNGLIDDGDMPGVNQPCVPGGPDHPQFQLKGDCRAGVQQCIAGGLTCVNYTGPQPEVCDGRDNDCDGVVDNSSICPSSGDACFHAQCVSPCAPGEFPCPYSFFCKELTEGRFCVPSPCFNKQCGEGEFCDPNSGECVNPCASVTCPTDTVCRQGRCLDCFVTGCATGTVCKADADRLGHCVPDLCIGVTCGATQMCTDGVCAETACNGQCAPGELCESGHCVARCTVDICFGVSCADGQVCSPASGDCIADPCRRTNCGTSACVTACDGTAQCVAHTGVDVLATGGGGTSCAITGRSAPTGSGLGTALLALGLLAARRRSGRPAGRSLLR